KNIVTFATNIATLLMNETIFTTNVKAIVQNSRYAIANNKSPTLKRFVFQLKIHAVFLPCSTL
ncbi:MAG: hypothetical protein C6Y22_06420, partial [Hapalosiphonaceae cyanobacterium JJU2]